MWNLMIYHGAVLDYMRGHLGATQLGAATLRAMGIPLALMATALHGGKISAGELRARKACYDLGY